MSISQFTDNAQELVPRSAALFHKRMGDSYVSGMHCDVVITCKGQEFKAAKFVLCQHSEVFAKMLTGAFKEAKEGAVDLQDDDPDTIRNLLEFCHCFTYTLEPPTTSQHLVRHIRLFVAADKYMMDELRDVALGHFRDACITSWDQPAFVEAIEEAYLRCAHLVFREIISTVAIAANDMLAGNRDQHSAFWDTVLEIPEFARDMLLALPTSRTNKAGRPYICPSCEEELMLSLRPSEEYSHDCDENAFVGKVLRQAHCQELLLNAEGRLVGGLAHGFGSDEAFDYQPTANNGGKLKKKKKKAIIFDF